MLNFFAPANKSLTDKLVFAICGLVLFCGFLFWIIAMYLETKSAMADVISFTASLSELTKQSIRYDMLTVKRDAIQLILENINRSGLIERVKIISIDGTIPFSTNKNEIGAQLADDEIRQLLPVASAGPAAARAGRQWQIDTSPAGYRILTYTEPILNETDCNTAACHFHDNTQKILGFLTTEFSLQAIDERLKKNMMMTSLYLVFFVVVVALALSSVLWKIVLKPVTELATGMKRVSAGDLRYKVSSPSDDELGRLAETFNEMTAELSATRQKLQNWNQSLEKEVWKQTREIKQTQDKLIQAEKLAALGRLSADIAHEIRNPLTALGGFGRRLLKSATTDKQKEYAQIVVSEVDRLEKILRDILTFSHKTKLELTNVSLEKVAQEALGFFADMLDERAITYAIKIETELPVLIDKAHTRQAINNLILNAIDAMANGGALTVTIRTEEHNDIDYVVLHVSDTGPGIPDEKLARIFEPFCSGKPNHGTGLGLSISQRIVEEHGGFIRAANNAEMGCTVSLYFPYQSDAEAGKMPCWEFMRCGRDRNSEAKCPAFPHFGRICWAVAGTLCAGKVHGSFAQKIATCRNCKFYLQIRGGYSLTN
jgi:signal transduction histidine kinase